MAEVAARFIELEFQKLLGVVEPLPTAMLRFPALIICQVVEVFTVVVAAF